MNEKGQPMLERMQIIFERLFEQLGQTVVWLVPGLVAALIVIALSTLVAVAVRLLLLRFLARVGFDRWMRELGVAPPADEPGATDTPTALAASLGFWTVMLLGLLAALSVFDTAPTRALVAQIAAYLPNVAVALLVLFIGLAVARFVERSVLISSVNMGLSSARLMGLGARWLVLVFTMAMAMAQLGVGGGIVTLAFGILFGGIVLAVALAFGLGARDLVARSLDRHFHTPGGPPADPGRAKKKDDEVAHL